MEEGCWVCGSGGYLDEYVDGLRDGTLFGALEAAEGYEFGGEEVQDAGDDAGAGDLGDQGFENRRVW